MIERAKSAGVTTLVMPAIDISSIHEAIVLCKRHMGLYAMTAIHPSDVKDATEEDYQAMAALCTDPHVIAIGESGLDYYWDRSFDAKQHDYFRRHIRLAIETDLPLILHIRDKQGRAEVYADILAILHEEKAASAQPERLRGIFHCFSGSSDVAAAAIALGFMLGLGGTLTFKNSGVAEIIRAVGLEHLVLETDAPFLAPVPYRGKRNEPAYIPYIAQKLAEVKAMPVEEIARITTENAKQMFGLVDR